MPYPKVLQIELTDICNARCSYCDRSRVTEGLMPIDLFRRIVAEVPTATDLHPQFWGESTLHPKFVEACEYAAGLGKRVNFYTNASRLDRLDVAALLRATNRMMVSMESTNPEHFAKVRSGLDFERVAANVRGAWNVKQTLGLSTKIVIRATNVFVDPEERQTFIDAWRPYCDELLVRDFTQTGAETFVPNRCALVDEHCVIKWDGTMVMCVVDHFADYVVGNVKEHSVLDLWNSERYRDLREKAGREHPICRSCWYLSDKKRAENPTSGGTLVSLRRSLSDPTRIVYQNDPV